MFSRNLFVSAMVLAPIPTAFAQELSSATQRAFIVSQFANELGKAELTNQTMQAQLSQSQKQVEDWKATFSAWCGSAPNCGRPTPENK